MRRKHKVVILALIMICQLKSLPACKSDDMLHCPPMVMMLTVIFETMFMMFISEAHMRKQLPPHKAAWLI